MPEDIKINILVASLYATNHLFSLYIKDVVFLIYRKGESNNDK